MRPATSAVAALGEAIGFYDFKPHMEHSFQMQGIGNPLVIGFGYNNTLGFLAWVVLKILVGLDYRGWLCEGRERSFKRSIVRSIE